jgi:hypothetical protein
MFCPLPTNDDDEPRADCCWFFFSILVKDDNEHVLVVIFFCFVSMHLEKTTMSQCSLSSFFVLFLCT